MKVWPSTAASWSSARSAGVERVEPGRDQRGASPGRPGRQVAGRRYAPSRARAGRRRRACGPSRPRTAGCRRRGRRSARRRAVGQPGHEPGQQLAHRRRRGSGSRASEAKFAPPGAPVGPPLEQLRPGQGDDVDRDARDPLEQVVDEVEQARVGPLEVLEHAARRGAVAGDALEERPPRGEQLLAADRPASPTPSRASSAGSIHRRSASSGDVVSRPSPRLRSRVVASSSVSARPARPRTISPSAQNVMPSPYAGERPWCQ